MQPLVQWKVKKYYTFRERVCSLKYTACNVYGPYCHLWPARLYSMLPHDLINDTIFEKKFLNIKCVL